MNKKKNVVIFSGGRGSKNLVIALNKLDRDINISTIINLYDDGKSTGIIRKNFNMPGPSDARKIQEIFYNLKNNTNNYKSKLLSKRINTKNINFIKNLYDFIYGKSDILLNLNLSNKKFSNQIRVILKKCFRNIKSNSNYGDDLSIMNLIYAGAYKICNKNINRTIKYISSIFDINNEIVSCGTKNLYLSGININNKIFYSEGDIVEQRSNVNMKEIFLLNRIYKSNELKNLNHKNKINYLKSLSLFDKISKEAKQLIKNADYIIYSPGTPYSSLYPTYLVKYIGNEIKKNIKAKKILITNIGADYETPKYTANDYIENTIKYLSFHNHIDPKLLINHVFINIPNSINAKYVKPYVSKLNKNNFNLFFENYENSKKKGIHDIKKLIKSLKVIFE